MKKKKLWIALLVAFVVLAASVVYLNRAVTLVPSRFMRKIVCRLRLSEVSRQYPERSLYYGKTPTIQSFPVMLQ